MAGAGLPLRVESQELLGHVAHGLLDAGLGLLPGPAAEPIHRRPRPLRARVLLDAVEALDRDLELVARLVAEHHELARGAADLQRLEAEEAADAVLLVDDEVARLEVAEVGQEPAQPAPLAPRVEVHLLREDVPVGEDRERGRGDLEARGRGRPRGSRMREPSPTARPSSRSTSARRSARPVFPRSTTVVAVEAAEVLGEAAHVAGVGGRRAAGDVDGAALRVHLPDLDERARPTGAPRAPRGRRAPPRAPGRARRRGASGPRPRATRSPRLPRGPLRAR